MMTERARRYAKPKTLASFILAAALGASAWAQGLELSLTWDGDDFEGFEGGLVLPRERGGEREVLRSNLRGSSRDGAVAVSPSLIGGAAAWSARALRPGLYGFFVSDLGSLEGLSAPGSLARAGLRVEVRTAAGSWSFTPPDRVGAIWHVFDLVGEDGLVSPVNAVLPQKTLVYGVVSDAVTGLPIEGASVTLTKKVDGSVLTAATRADGKYMIPADFGAWAISVDKEGAIGWKDELAFIGSEYPVRADAHLSSVLADKQYRFVLSWGSSPADLDAHLVGPTPSGGEFHISYRTMRAYERRHFLDRDDQDGLGPETVTVEKLDPGVYVFAVHDYSYSQSSSSRALSYSGAKVRVYREAELVAEAAVPEGAAGTVWRAFSLDGRTGSLTRLDQMLFEREPSRIR